MPPARWKVGELARRAGISIRTLHYYDEIGLLSPSARSPAGYRLYTAEDIARLQQIKGLRSFGFPLEAIRDLLTRTDIAPRQIIALQLRRLQEQIALQRRLYDRLEGIAGRLDAAESVSPEEFLQTMELMSMIENVESYYTAEQLETLAARRQQLGEERIRQVEAEWPALIGEVRAAMERGVEPTSEPVLALARRWQALIDEFTGGDPGISAALGRMYEKEPALRERTGVNEELSGYIGKALAAIRLTD